MMLPLVQIWLLTFSLLSRFATAEVDPIIIKGSHFFYSSNGTEFVIRGVRFQKRTVIQTLEFTDPLIDETACTRAVEKLVQIKTNVIYVEAINPQLEHSKCMEAFADAGIYVLAALVPPFVNEPTPQSAWDTTAYNYSTAIIDNMGKYTNLLGFYAPKMEPYSPGTGPRMIVPIMKAMIRDTKAYIASKEIRKIPVGMITETAWFNETFVDHALDFLSCGDLQSDFMGILNAKIMCPTVDWIEESGTRFERASMPVFLSSSGCETSDSEREKALYSQKALSGGFLYQFYYDTVNFGLCDLESKFNSGLLIEQPLFTDVKSIMATQTIDTMNIATYTPAPSITTACPTYGDGWFAVGATLAPSPNGRVCNCMTQTLECSGNSVVIEKIDTSYGILLDYYEMVCGENRDQCPGTGTDPATGTYGAFRQVQFPLELDFSSNTMRSACSRDERLSWDMSWWSKYNSSSDRDCKIKGTINPVLGNLSDFNGIMTRQTPALNLDGECKFLLDQAGVNGTGTVTDFQFARATPAPTSSSTSTSNNSSLDRDQSSEISIGAKVAIGLGAAVVVIIALLLILFVLHRRKKVTKQDHKDLGKGGPEEQPLKAELEAKSMMEMEGAGTMAEVPCMNATPWELPADDRPMEMYVSNENGGVQHLPIRDRELSR